MTDNSLGQRLREPFRRLKNVLFNFRPTARPTLKQILWNQLCPPLDLRGFRYFLTYHERSYENLSFYEFVVAYWILWARLPSTERKRAPPVVGRSLHPDLLPCFPHLTAAYPSDALTLNHVLIGSESRDFTPLTCDKDICRINMLPCFPSPMESFIKLDTDVADLKQALISYCHGKELEPWMSPDASAPEKINFDFDPTAPSFAARLDKPRSSQLTFFGLMAQGGLSGGDQRRLSSISEVVKKLEAQKRPLADVVGAALDHYIMVGGIEEINISQRIRQTILEEAATTSHPSIWEPAYLEVMRMLERTAEGQFTKWSVQNISSAEAFRRSRTFIPLILITIAMVVLMIYYEVSRWYRLFTIPLVLVITMYLITNTRGVCIIKYNQRTRDRRLQGGPTQRFFDWFTGLGRKGSSSSTTSPEARRKSAATQSSAHPSEFVLGQQADELYYTPDFRIPSVLDYFIHNFENAAHRMSDTSLMLSPAKHTLNSTLTPMPASPAATPSFTAVGSESPTRVDSSHGPLATTTTTTMTKSGLTGRDSGSNESSQWLPMDEPLVRQGQREILAHAIAASVVVVFMVESIVVAIF
ncbi:hypothetical protein BJ085DRAFT_28989 [Dimargaris cristalligena]|uniref:RGS domain-containing protein n=1 Tax=Dimargaris cristalligena TaxID=215637 RepID=A0A4P9ZZN1_9FUNG|nr:hypothetical protein BJ085DRAFT_28989 [Dimargaris cristalligena]|eukprot:RKP38581.1 hypothetical protein BJ085DRAFT_28989 [Dimargaris cristalligena]